MILHMTMMSSAFFVALPIGKDSRLFRTKTDFSFCFLGIVMRTVSHGWHGFVVLVFYGLNALGLAAGGLYKKLSPNM